MRRRNGNGGKEGESSRNMEILGAFVLYVGEGLCGELEVAIIQ